MPLSALAICFGVKFVTLEQEHDGPDNLPLLAARSSILLIQSLISHASKQAEMPSSLGNVNILQ